MGKQPSLRFDQTVSQSSTLRHLWVAAKRGSRRVYPKFGECRPGARDALRDCEQRRQRETRVEDYQAQCLERLIRSAFPALSFQQWPVCSTGNEKAFPLSSVTSPSNSTMSEKAACLWSRSSSDSDMQHSADLTKC